MSLILRLTPKHKDQFIEDSVPLRVVTTALALTGVMAAWPQTEAPLWLVLLSVFGSILGSFVSYKRRYSSNFIVKIWLSVGIVAAAVVFFDELIVLANQNVADARIPLTKLLMVLIALHCFDVPRRRDLSVSFLVGLTLMASASTLSRELNFTYYLLAFLALTMSMFLYDCESRTLSRARDSGANVDKTLDDISNKFDLQKQRQSKTFRLSPAGLHWLLGFVLLLLMSFGTFIVAPKIQLNLAKEWKLGGSLPFQIQSQLLSRMPNLLSGDGSIRKPANAYFGFSEEFDTNYRGALTDDVVLRVSSKTGTFLRGMAYDTFDGKIWRMLRPKETKEILAREDHGFSLSLKQTSFSRVKSTNVTQMIYVEADSTNLVVCANTPYQIYFPSPSLQVDTYGGIRSPVGIQKDMVYTVFSQVPHFDYTMLRTTPDNDENHPRRYRLSKELREGYLQIPSQVENYVRILSKKIAGEGNNFKRAERLCNFLQKNYDYDLEVEMTPDSRDSVSDFLIYTHRGFCEHFASALVIMCRTQGIPARLVTGYTCGDYNPFTGLWEIKLKDAHSWAEIYTGPNGWVPLDATPNGRMESLEIEQQSVFSYIEKLLKPLIANLSQSKFWHGIESYFIQFVALALRISVAAYTWTVQQLPLLGGLAVLITVGAVVFNKLGVRGFWQKYKWGGKRAIATQDSYEEASKEYLKVASNLSVLGIERKMSETTSELLERTGESLEASSLHDPEFICELGKFMELYSEIRFGGSSNELSQLKEMTLSLDKMSKNMSEQ